MTDLDYVVAVQAPGYAISATEFAIESAFAAHLLELKATMAPEFTRLVLIAPLLPQQTYEQQKSQLAVLSADQGITLVSTQHLDCSVAGYWLRELPNRWRPVWQAISKAGIFHTGMASDVWRPTIILTNFAAWVNRRPTVFFVDIDYRRHTERSYKLGTWGMKSYLTNVLFYDRVRWLQVWLATRLFNLCLLKSTSMVEAFGRGRPHVKPFLDTAHAPEAVLTEAELIERQERLCRPDAPLNVTYFGRFVPYKGLQRSIDAVAHARRLGADVRLRLVGDGSERENLRAHAASAGISDHVEFVDAVPYGAPLFALLSGQDVAIATPLLEDTPRAAIDAMARGIPVVAFDIEYFRYLSELSGAVGLANWPSAESTGEILAALHRDRERLAGMSGRAVAFARDNTQRTWLLRRAAWVREYCLGKARDAREDAQTAAISR